MNFQFKVFPYEKKKKLIKAVIRNLSVRISPEAIQEAIQVTVTQMYKSHVSQKLFMAHF